MKKFAKFQSEGTFVLKPREVPSLIAMGMVWLNEESGKRTPRRATLFLYALCQADLLVESQRRYIAKNGNSINHFEQHCYTLRVKNKKPQPGELESLAQSRGEYFILIVPGEGFDRSRILGPDGYLLYITRSGEKFAGEQMQKERRINKLAFLLAWDKARQQIAAIASRQKPRYGTGSDEDE